MNRFLHNPLVVAVAAFVQVFLLCVQTKNIQHDDVLLAGLTSLGISCTWFVSVLGVVHNWPCRVGFMVGGALGAMASIPFYQWIR